MPTVNSICNDIMDGNSVTIVSTTLRDLIVEELSNRDHNGIVFAGTCPCTISVLKKETQETNKTYYSPREFQFGKFYVSDKHPDKIFLRVRWSTIWGRNSCYDIYVDCVTGSSWSLGREDLYYEVHPKW